MNIYSNHILWFLLSLFCKGFVCGRFDNKLLFQDLANEAIKLLAAKTFIGWVSSSHMASLVLVFAIGAGAEEFTGRMDNTDILNKIAKLAGY
jgi:alkaline phosphatase